jgi:hypothetical protein
MQSLQNLGKQKEQLIFYFLPSPCFYNREKKKKKKKKPLTVLALNLPSTEHKLSTTLPRENI